MYSVDGHDDAIIGQGSSYGRQTCLVYSIDKIIDKLMKRDGMTDEEALEYFNFNIAGAYHGSGMPVFIWQDNVDI